VPDDEAVLDALAMAIDRLSADQPLTVLEFGADGPVRYRVSLDRAGIPHVRRSPVEQHSQHRESSLPETVGRLVLVSSVPDPESASRAFAHWRAERPDASAWVVPGANVRQLLAEAIADSPIQQSYGLMVVHAGSGEGRLRLASKPLFVKGERRGAVAGLTVRNECADGQGTVFAVVAWEGNSPSLLSADSVPLPPGLYHVRAELRRPGEVRFIEPANVSSDPRSLSELLATIPPSLNPVQDAHLVCAIEVAGPAAQAAARVYAAEKIIKTIYGALPESSRLRVGLLVYGGHRFSSRRADNRVIVAEWLASPPDALESLGRLGACDLGNPYAAQVEDMLAAVTHQLGPKPQPHRTVLLVLGERPPHPPAIGGAVPPCPRRLNWNNLLAGLEQRPDITIAAIRDQSSGPGTTAWTRIGSAALQSLDSLDVGALAVHVGLVAPSLRHMPIPVVADPDPARR
jgi:hypothetical protein